MNTPFCYSDGASQKRPFDDEGSLAAKRLRLGAPLANISWIHMVMSPYQGTVHIRSTPFASFHKPEFVAMSNTVASPMIFDYGLFRTWFQKAGPIANEDPVEIILQDTDGQPSPYRITDADDFCTPWSC